MESWNAICSRKLMNPKQCLYARKQRRHPVTLSWVGGCAPTHCEGILECMYIPPTDPPTVGVKLNHAGRLQAGIHGPKPKVDHIPHTIKEEFPCDNLPPPPPPTPPPSVSQ